MSPALYDSLLELMVRRLHNQLAGAQLVDWAVGAVQQGVETDALVLLAGLSRDCALSEAVPLLDRGIAELGLTVPDPESLPRAYVGAVSRAILAEEVPIPVALEHLHRWVVTPLNHPADLAPWCFLWEGLHPESFESLDAGQVEAEAQRLASSWASASPPASSP